MGNFTRFSISFFFWSPFDLYYNTPLNFFFKLACLKLKCLVHSPFQRLYEYVFQKYGGFSQIRLFVELSCLRDNKAELNVRCGQYLVLDHLKFDCNSQPGELKVGHFDCLLLVDSQFYENLGWRVFWKL